MATNGVVSTETEHALVVWINSFSLEGEVESLGQLNDGQVFWQMLRDIDSDAFPESLPNNKQSDYARRKNLEFIHRHIQDYLDDRGKGYNALAEEELEKLAAADPGPSVIKFLKLVLTVMLESPNMTEQVQKVMALPPSTQEIVGGFMQEVADLGSDLDPTDNGSESSLQEDSTMKALSVPDARTDQILQLEQQYAKVMSQLERRNQEFKDLEMEMETVSKSLERAQENNEALNQQIGERDDQLKKARSMASDREQSSMKDLETKISQQEESLASKDNQMSKHQSDIAELQRERRRLLVSDEKLQKLQDEYDVMKVELERQTRKGNTADKYMQKLQANQGLERERDTLRQELDDARTQLSTLGKIRQENAALQKSNDEASRTLSQIEQEHEELRMTKKQLRVNYDSLARQVDALNERFAQDQETIAELRERNGGSDAMLSPRIMNGGLEGELHETSKNEDQMRSMISELQRQNQKLISDISDKDAKNNTLQRQLNIAIESSAEHTGQVGSLREEIIALQTSLTEVREGHPIEGTVTFRKMREQLKAEEQKRLNLERGTSDPHQDAPSENDQKSRDQRLDKAELTKILKELSKGQIDDSLTRAVATKLEDMLASKLSESIENAARQQKRIQDQGINIRDLEERLQQERIVQENQPAPSETSPEDHLYIQNLERELKLIASAYHDLAGRLQMNTVVLQRRAEAPKSWLGRQRKAMEGPTGLSR